MREYQLENASLVIIKLSFINMQIRFMAVMIRTLFVGLDLIGKALLTIYQS